MSDRSNNEEGHACLGEPVTRFSCANQRAPALAAAATHIGNVSSSKYKPEGRSVFLMLSSRSVGPPAATSTLGSLAGSASPAPPWAAAAARLAKAARQPLRQGRAPCEERGTANEPAPAASEDEQMSRCGAGIRAPCAAARGADHVAERVAQRHEAASQPRRAARAPASAPTQPSSSAPIPLMDVG